MEKIIKYEKLIKCIFFISIIVFLFITSNPINTIRQYSSTLLSQFSLDNFDDNNSPISSYSNEYIQQNKYLYKWVKLSGLTQKAMNNYALFNNDNIYVDHDGYIYSKYSYADAEYEFDQINKLNDYLKEKSISLLYVNLPGKYTNDSFISKTFGVQSYLNDNADRLMQKLSYANIDYLDLRDSMKTENLEAKNLFYKGDHHWTNLSGFWACQKIIDTMNQRYNYNIDTDTLNINNFNKYDMPKSWVGEQALKLGITNSVYDDYTLLSPKYETEYKIDYPSGEEKTSESGDFNTFINYPVLDYSIEELNYPSYYYLYLYYHHGMKINNCKKKSGRVLYVCDSFSHSMAQFLSLNFNELDILDLRYYHDSLENALKNDYGYDYDTIIICISPTLIGAHSNSVPLNCNAFTFFD